MFYNMGRFDAAPDMRSIFDARSAGRYIARIPRYPLPLDAALPIWSWTLHLRDERVVGILQSTDPEELDGDAFPFLRTETPSPPRWLATQTAFLHGELLREGDELKGELIGPTDTLAASTMIAPLLHTAPRTVVLFDLSERNLKRHGTGQLDQVFRTFRR
jgi:hypothetical protein